MNPSTSSGQVPASIEDLIAGLENMLGWGGLAAKPIPPKNYRRWARRIPSTAAGMEKWLLCRRSARSILTRWTPGKNRTHSGMFIFLLSFSPFSWESRMEDELLGMYAGAKHIVVYACAFPNSLLRSPLPITKQRLLGESRCF